MNPTAQRRFYTEILGMLDFDDGSVGYGGDEARITFLQAEQQYRPAQDDLYWKIALAVPNIDLAYQQLLDLSVAVSKPKQFRDIGYLAHLQDPEGFTIELIDYNFEHEAREVVPDKSLFGGGAHLNLLTLRTADMSAVESVRKNLGMKALSVQPVKPHGFTLYFYAFTSDRPPDSDLESIQNRTWLYRRRYTVLEVQHKHELLDVRRSKPPESGYSGVVVTGVPGNINESSLLIQARSNLDNK